MPKSIDGIVLKAPHPQNAFDLFAGEWAYDIPVENTRTGAGMAFREKHYCVWQLEQAFGSLRGMSCLELGPNEGEVAFHLHHAGCREVLSIEARSRNFLKCIIAKNVLQMSSVQFMLGDFVQFLELTTNRYDICMAAGVLYHMTNPLKVLDLIAQKCDRVAIATHYFTQGMLKYDPSKDTTGLATASWDIKDPNGEDLTHNGITARVYKYFYRGRLQDHEDYGHGGPAPHAFLMQKDDILRALTHYGMRVLEPIHDDPDGGRGAHLCVIAERVR